MGSTEQSLVKSTDGLSQTATMTLSDFLDLLLTWMKESFLLPQLEVKWSW
jgi:hypothetical protein